MMEPVDLFAQAKKQPTSLEELQHALSKYQGLQFYLEAPEEEMSSEWWPLEAVRELPFDPLGRDVKLPSFGGDAPAQLETPEGERVLSWDESRYLIVEAEELRIISHDEWANYSPA